VIRHARRTPTTVDSGPGLRSHGEEVTVLILDDQEDGARALAVELVVEGRTEGDDARGEPGAGRGGDARERDTVRPHGFGGRASTTTAGDESDAEAKGQKR